MSGKTHPIVARATGQKPEKPAAPSALMSLARGLEALTRKFLDTAADFGRRIAAIEARPAPRDGVGVASGVIDRDGALVLTLTSGQTVVVGKVAAEAPSAEFVADLVTGRIRPSLEALQADFAATIAANRGVSETIDRAVAAAIAALPEQKVGAAPDLPDIPAMVASAVAALPKPQPGAPGVGLAGALIDRSGHLVVTLSDGTSADLGAVVGHSVSADEIEPWIEAAVSKAVAALNLRNGEDANPETTAALVRAEVAKAVEAIPQMIASAVAELPPPEPGRSVTIDDVAPLVNEVVARAVSKLPAAKDGVGIADALITGEGRLAIVLSDNRRLDAGVVVPEAIAGPAGRSIASGVIDDAGHLILRLSDANEIDVGLVRGKDGESIKGDPGRSVDSAAIDETGHLVLEFSDGASADLGRVVGEDGHSIKGDPGRGISDVAIVDNALTVTFTDNTTATLGRVVGKDGKAAKAIKGDPGDPGVLKIIDVRPSNLTAADLGTLQEIEIEAEDGHVIRLYGRA